MTTDQATILGTPKKHDSNALNSLYLDGDSIDQEVFAEMRSNLLLVVGEHYNRRQANFYKRIRDSKELSIEQKLRLTKNHVQNICKKYVNNIISHQPGVGFSPRREDDMHDVKVTEIAHKLWQDAKQKYTLNDKMDDWCDDFVEVGEVAVKIFFDPFGGEVKGYEPILDDDTGEPYLNEVQQYVPDETKPVFKGQFIFEEIFGFNLLRPSECKDMRAAEWLCIRKMANTTELKSKFKDSPDVLKFIVTAQDETYMIFDGSRGSYRKTKNQTMLREYYFRPCSQYPEGYFYITTKEGILAQGALPGGIFPIIVTQFDRIQTTPRGRSPVKHMRPYQAEINRSASKTAEHQITLGDDKILIQNGIKISAGIALPGVRSINYQGKEPTVLQGRSGEQYVQYGKDSIAELYQVMNVQEDDEDENTNLDPYSLLFRAASRKKKFQRWIKRFESFLIEVCKTYLRLAKIHMTDEDIAEAIGMDDFANITEFRNAHDLAYTMNIEAEADDIEQKFGKQLVLNHALQYVGGQLKPADIGRMMNEMPYANFKGTFSDMTLDADIANDDLLALDRGEQPPVGEYDNHPYMIQRLTARMRKRDFKYFGPNIQHNYSSKIQVHQAFEAAKQKQIQLAEQGFIPSGGYSVTCQLYVTDPSDPSGQKTRLARVPYSSLVWLIEKLQAQGQGQQELQGMNEGNQAQIASKLTMPGSPMPPMGQPGPGGPQRRPMPLSIHSFGKVPGQGLPMGQPGTAVPRGMMQ